MHPAPDHPRCQADAHENAWPVENVIQGRSRLRGDVSRLSQEGSGTGWNRLLPGMNGFDFLGLGARDLHHGRQPEAEKVGLPVDGGFGSPPFWGL